MTGVRDHLERLRRHHQLRQHLPRRWSVVKAAPSTRRAARDLRGHELRHVHRRLQRDHSLRRLRRRSGLRLEPGRVCGCLRVRRAIASGGRWCGLVGDGCGDTIDCGVCTGPGEACGRAGVPNVCRVGSCTATCLSSASTADSQETAVAVRLSAGVHRASTCGGGGQGNVCGAPACNPLTCLSTGAECGWIGGGCGDVVNCGPCANGGCAEVGPNLCGVLHAARLHSGRRGCGATATTAAGSSMRDVPGGLVCGAQTEPMQDGFVHGDHRGGGRAVWHHR